MAGSVQDYSLSSTSSSPLAYRTGFYVGALHGYQTVSEVSPVDGPDFCRGFADGIEVIMSWVKHYLTEGGTFESALGDLMPYFPTLRAWMGDASAPARTKLIRPPGRRDRQRRQWEQSISSVLSDNRWWTAKEISARLDGRGPQSQHTLNQVLRAMATSGRIECSNSLDLIKSRTAGVRWRVSPSGGSEQSAG